MLIDAAAMPATDGQSSSSYFTPVSDGTSITPCQETVLTCIRRVFADATAAESRHRAILPDLFGALCRLVTFAVRLPTTVVPAQQRPSAPITAVPSVNEYLITNGYVVFGETCMRTLVELYTATAHYGECGTQVLAMIIQALTVPLAHKYACARETVWQTAARCLQQVVKAGLALVRGRQADVNQQRMVFTALSTALHAFLFHQT